jgi:hypothetical protein
MTDASQLRKLPWWVKYWTDPKTTPASLLRDARFDFLTGAAFLACFAVAALYWKFLWLGVLGPAAFAAAGTWKLTAKAWIDRHQAWDRVATQKAALGGATGESVKSSAAPGTPPGSDPAVR